jgi:hypothetical protein
MTSSAADSIRARLTNAHYVEAVRAAGDTVAQFSVPVGADGASVDVALRPSDLV